MNNKLNRFSTNNLCEQAEPVHVYIITEFGKWSFQGRAAGESYGLLIGIRRQRKVKLK